MSSKKWCIAAVFAVILAVGAIIAFNVKEDPFGVFGDEWYSYNETNNPRVAKIEYLKKNHDKYKKNFYVTMFSLSTWMRIHEP